VEGNNRAISSGEGTRVGRHDNISRAVDLIDTIAQ
jgi:hypothetical protein